MEMDTLSESLLKVAVVVSLLALALGVVGCGGMFASRAQGMHDVLNTATDIVDPAYDLAVTSCRVGIDLIETRTGTTLNEDQTALAELRTSCERIFAKFEDIRQAQLKARRLVDIAVRIDDEPTILAALGALSEMKGMWDALAVLLRNAGVGR